MTLGRLAPLLSILLQVLGLGLGLGSNMLMARLLGPVGYGEYAFVYNIVTIVAVPMEVGLVMVVVRDASALLSMQDEAALARVARAATRVCLGFAVPCALVMALMGKWGGASVGAYGAVFVAASLLMPISSYQVMRAGLLRAAGYPLWSQVLSNVVRPLVFFAMLLVMYFWGAGAGQASASIMVWHALAAGLALLFGLSVKPTPWTDAARDATPPSGWAAWRRDIPGFSMMAAVMALNQGLGSMAAAYHLGPKDVGLYRMAEMAASLVAMPLSTLSVYYSSPLARQLADGDQRGLVATLRTASRLASACALPMAVGLAVLGPWLLVTLFKQEFVNAYAPMMVLCMAQVLNSMTGMCGMVMSMAGRHREAMLVLIGAVLVQSLAGGVLTPHFGLMGVALASAAGTLCWSQVLRWRVFVHHGLSTSVLGRTRLV
jgi:O-antigen/teichoic acid export membrane protein